MVFLTWIRIHIYFKVVCLVSFRHLLVSVFPAPSFSPSLSLSLLKLEIPWYCFDILPSGLQEFYQTRNREQTSPYPDVIQQQSGWVFLPRSLIPQWSPEGP